MRNSVFLMRRSILPRRLSLTECRLRRLTATGIGKERSDWGWSRCSAPRPSSQGRDRLVDTVARKPGDRVMPLWPCAGPSSCRPGPEPDSPGAGPAQTGPRSLPSSALGRPSSPSSDTAGSPLDRVRRRTEEPLVQETSAFSRLGDSNFLKTDRSLLNRRNRVRNAASLAKAVAIRHRRSNSR